MLEAVWPCTILCFLFTNSVTEYINAMFLLVIKFKMMGMQLNVVHVPGPKKLTKTYNKGV